MSWHAEVARQLADSAVGGYLRENRPATEPTALACAALVGVNEVASARRAADWLLEHQQKNGGLGISAQQDTPCWPTNLAVMAWMAIHDRTGEPRYREAAERAIRSTLSIEGATSPRIKEIGHDTTLLAWPWVEGTHSWLEPTAWAVLALKRTGHGDHPRTREAIKVLIDRQFPSGGCNYGNTFVLGQQLEPHVQPTGVVLMALFDERASSAIARSATWLASQWPTVAGLASRSFAAQALCVFGITPDDCQQQLQSEWERIIDGNATTYQLALLTLARLNAVDNPLLPTAWQPATTETNV